MYSSNWSEISSNTPTIEVLIFKTSVSLLNNNPSNVPGWFLATKKLYFLLNCANSADVVPTLTTELPSLIKSVSS